MGIAFGGVGPRLTTRVVPAEPGARNQKSSGFSFTYGFGTFLRDFMYMLPYSFTIRTLKQQRRFLLGGRDPMVSRGPTPGTAKTASTKLSKQWQEHASDI